MDRYVGINWFGSRTQLIDFICIISSEIRPFPKVCRFIFVAQVAKGCIRNQPILILVKKFQKWGINQKEVLLLIEDKFVEFRFGFMNFVVMNRFKRIKTG